jgi:HAD superfamily hydrolase (TIGR01509 family)
MDGLLVETEPLWYQAELAVIDEIGGTWSAEHQETLLGGPLERAVALLIEQSGGSHDEAEVMNLLLSAMEGFVRSEPVSWRPGAPALLTRLDAAGVPLALVSASWRRIVDAVHDAVLHELGHEMFAVTVAGDDLPRTKPFPDPYLRAAEVIGVEPRHCVVLEDSHVGSRAGLASGGFVVVVPSLVTIEPEPGLHVVSSLDDLTPAMLGEWSYDWAPRP